MLCGSSPLQFDIKPCTDRLMPFSHIFSHAQRSRTLDLSSVDTIMHAKIKACSCHSLSPQVCQLHASLVWIQKMFETKLELFKLL